MNEVNPFITCLRISDSKFHLDYITAEDIKSFNRVETPRGFLRAVNKYHIWENYEYRRLGRSIPIDTPNWYKLWVFLPLDKSPHLERKDHQVTFSVTNANNFWAVKGSLKSYLATCSSAIFVKFSYNWTEPIDIDETDQLHHAIWGSYSPALLKHLTDRGFDPEK